MFEDCTIALSKCIQSREFIQPNATFQLKRKDKIKLLTKEELFYDEIQQNLNIENCEKLRFYAKGPQLLIKLRDRGEAAPGALQKFTVFIDLIFSKILLMDLNLFCLLFLF
jgi:hypothetical protein